MIFYIVTDSWDEYTKNKKFWEKDAELFESLADNPCAMIHYSKVTPKILAKLNPAHIIHSGNTTPFSRYDVLTKELYADCVLETDIPQLGICGGFQIIGGLFGANLTIMRKLKTGEKDPDPNYFKGNLKEKGLQQISIVDNGRLLKDLPKEIDVIEEHAFELKDLPEGFTLLATSPLCRIQAFEHQTKPIFGVQFHPERSTPKNPDGIGVLLNFFSM